MLRLKVGGVTTIGTAAAGRAGAAEIAALWAAAGTRITGTRIGEENGNGTDEGLASAEPMVWIAQCPLAPVRANAEKSSHRSTTSCAALVA